MGPVDGVAAFKGKRGGGLLGNAISSSGFIRTAQADPCCHSASYFSLDVDRTTNVWVYEGSLAGYFRPFSLDFGSKPNPPNLRTHLDRWGPPRTSRGSVFGPAHSSPRTPRIDPRSPGRPTQGTGRGNGAESAPVGPKGIMRLRK